MYKLLAVSLSITFLACGQEASSKVNGYFPEWGPGATLNGFLVKNLVTTGAAAKLTYLTFAFAQVSSNGTCSMDNATDDVGAQYSAAQSVSGVADPASSTALRGIFHQLQELKQLYPIKVLVSVGGATLSGPISSAVSTSTNRTNFVNSCIKTFIDGNFGLAQAYPGIFDGIDIDWEYPSNTTYPNGSTDKTNFTALMSLFRSSLGSQYLLTATGPAGPWNYEYMNLGAIAQSLNFFNVMTYDYDGPWSKTTGFVAPLYAPNGDLSVDQTIEAYRGAGVPSSKILLGLPFYAYRWTSVPSGSDYGMNETGTPQPTLPTSPTYSYAYVAALPNYSTSIHHDSTSTSPWLYTPYSVFYTFEDPTSANCKVHYAQHYGLAGVVIWDLSGDTSSASLLKAISSDMETTSNAGCPAFTDSAMYNFETSTQGWVKYTPTNGLSGISSVAVSSTEFLEGSHSLAVTFDPTHYTSSPQVYVPAPAIAAGKTVQFYVWIPEGSTVVGIEPFVQDKNWAWTSNYVSTLYENGWNIVTVTVPSTAVTPLQEIGIQFTLSGASSGTVYIDSVGPQ
ncbi:MAG: glycosyl hydrolase family 18 protein [Bryobacteraceae bacterium]